MHRPFVAVVCVLAAGLARKIVSPQPDDGSITAGMVGRTDRTSAITVFQSRRAKQRRENRPQPVAVISQVIG